MNPTENRDGDRPPDIARLVRPYLMTGGRTSVGAELALETQLQSTAAGLAMLSLRWESARIVELARQPIALVELAARLMIPIDVTRVLVSDLTRTGAITAPQPAMETSTTAPTSHTSLLEKVLDGVRSL